MHEFRELLPNVACPIIGMVHLKSLPGTFGYGGSLAEVIDAAVADARSLAAGGIDGIMIENYGDLPFRKGQVEPHRIAAMALVTAEIRRITQKPLGINVLRNDPLAAVGIAAICSASMIRINVHTGAMLTDQGLIEGDANRTIEYRTKLGSSVKILADTNVKHAAPLASTPIEEAAADSVERGLADAIIVTGNRTGADVDFHELRRVRNAVEHPVLVGSGVSDTSIALLMAECDGAIVGSWLKEEGRLANPISRKRVEQLMEIVRQEREQTDGKGVSG